MATATRRVGRSTRIDRAALTAIRSLDDINPDRYRGFVFPNNIREHRQNRGFHRLMALSNRLADIPYIRLSKIERGEVVARADELIRIAGTLGIDAGDLLIDIDAADFDISVWAEPFHDPRSWDSQVERNSVLLGAALRCQRNKDRSLTIARLDQEFGLPAVILSRLENAQKPLLRWNEATLASLCRLFASQDVPTLLDQLAERYLRGELDAFVQAITDPDARRARTRQRIEELRAELRAMPDDGPDLAPRAAKLAEGALGRAETSRGGAPASPYARAARVQRTLTVLGTPMSAGLIASEPTATVVDAPTGAGPRAFALRVCRATLGAGLPPNAVVIVDPDRPPSLGSLAVIRSGDAYRIVSVTLDRSGATMGYSVTPDVAVNIDELDSGDVAAVIGAIFP